MFLSNNYLHEGILNFVSDDQKSVSVAANALCSCTQPS
jgi:hypothetical protein